MDDDDESLATLESVDWDLMRAIDARMNTSVYTDRMQLDREQSMEIEQENVINDDDEHNLVASASPSADQASSSSRFPIRSSVINSRSINGRQHVTADDNDEVYDCLFRLILFISAIL